MVEMTDMNRPLEVVKLVSEVVAAYVSNHIVSVEDVPHLINVIYTNLCNLNTGPGSLLASPSEPAVPIKDSIKPDFLVCLEDGRKLKMLMS